MQVKRTNTSDTDIKLIVIPTETELANMKQHVLGHFRSRVKIAGFREGKAPLELVEKHADANMLQTEFLEEAVNEFYVQTIQRENLRPIANPKVNITKFVPFTTLEFEAEVSVLGEVTLPDYQSFKLPKEKVAVSAEDVKQVLDDLRTRGAERKDVKRPAKSGDQVVIDFKGVDAKGNAVEGAEGKDYPLLLGSNSFIPGFEANLDGVAAGEEKTFSVTFPADYSAKALAKKKVTFTVTVHKVQEVVQPKLDDAFAATVGPFTSLQQLKDDIKKQLIAEKENQAARAYENELIMSLADKTKVVLPKSMVEDQIDKIEDQERQNLVYRGQTWEEHLKEENVTAEQHREQKRPEAERSIRASLMLSEIAQKEGLDVTSEELELRIQLLKGQYPDESMQAELDKTENRRDIASRILTEKTIEKLTSYATK
jgi:trigger factor